MLGCCLGAGRDLGAAPSVGLTMPVSSEMELKENFLSPCPSYKSIRERETFPPGISSDKKPLFSKAVREKKCV